MVAAMSSLNPPPHNCSWPEYWDDALELSLVHSISPAQDFYVTSPNMQYIPTIVQGIVHVHLRADGSYGDVDPMVCPQMHVPRFAYMAAVRKQVPPSHPYTPIWLSPSPLDFHLLTGTPVSGLGLLSRAFLRPYHVLAKHLRQEVVSYCAGSADQNCPLLRWHDMLVSQALSRLRVVPASFRDQCLQLANLQRHFLFADAYLEYHHRLLNLGARSGGAGLIGAWTSSPSDVHHLFALGLPVWFVRRSNLAFHRPTGGQLVHCAPLPARAQSPPHGTPAIYVGLVGERQLTAIVEARPQYLDISYVPSATRHDSVCPAPPISQARAHQIAAASKADITGIEAAAGCLPLTRKKKCGRRASKPCASCRLHTVAHLGATCLYR